MSDVKISQLVTASLPLIGNELIPLVQNGTTYKATAQDIADLAPPPPPPLPSWELAGNSGTTSGTDYIGTSDATDLVIKTNATESIRILSSGEVGIGTSSPMYKLDVNGITNISNDLYVMGNAGIGTTSPTYALDVVGTINASNNLYAMGNAGIGTTSPTVKLDVIGSTKISDNLTVEDYAYLSTTTGGVGIGLSSITAGNKLQVSGSTRFDGTITMGEYFVDPNDSDSYQIIFKAKGVAGVSQTATISLDGGSTGAYGSLNIISGNSSLGQIYMQAAKLISPNIIMSLGTSGLILRANSLTSGVSIENGYGQTSGNLFSVSNNAGGSQPFVLTAANEQVGIGTNTPDVSAKVHINSTFLGFLPPRMSTTQRNAIVSPAEGLIVYDMTLHNLYVYNGSTWNACF